MFMGAKLRRNCHQGIFTKLLIKACVSCGFIVNSQVPWLGASSDCLLYDPTECKPYGIGEVKCPFSKKEMTEIIEISWK